jgi:hypothetical protein
MFSMLRHALALFVPALHCVTRAAGLEADEHCFGRGGATTEDSCGMIFQNHNTSKYYKDD